MGIGASSRDRPRRSPPRLADVLRTARPTPHVLRVTFGGDALADFPTGHETANVKLLLRREGQDEAGYLAALAGDGERPVKRTYTVLAHRPADGAHGAELDIDFALHEAPGPATRWALAARPGDRVGLAGPGTPKRVDPDADWFLLAGDASALPAIEANLRALRADACGHAVIEVGDATERRELGGPPGVTVHWIVDAGGDAPMRSLVDVLKALDWLPGTPYAWIAGETGAVRELRAWLADERGLDRGRRYTSGYWQLGHDEDSHQLVKRAEPMD